MAVGEIDVNGIAALPLSVIDADVLDPGDAASAAALFKALGDPVRVRLLALVAHSPNGEACFCDLADEFDLPQSTLSHHVKMLVNAGLLSRERRGTWSWYRVQDEPLETMTSLVRTHGMFRPHRLAPTRLSNCD